ncbi:hypothetical protein ACCO45_006866 [Purpureocillium lilacinum]|uniref:Uncharacterized protein n=1 Tax=Purpureocillium lilacinum TaxID=33203 RepID=A0ACC4DS61_PURLI
MAELGLPSSSDAASWRIHIRPPPSVQFQTPSCDTSARNELLQPRRLPPIPTVSSFVITESIIGAARLRYLQRV